MEDDEITATGYALMDNQSALLADWDFEVLGELMAELLMRLILRTFLFMLHRLEAAVEAAEKRLKEGENV